MAHAAGEVLTALAERHDGLAAASQVYDRAARTPRGGRGGAGAGRIEVGLRRVARQLLRQRRVPGGGGPAEEAGSVALAVALAALLVEVAAWHRDHGRGHQAVAARRAAGMVEGWTAPRRAHGQQLALLDLSARDRPRRDHAATARGPRPDHASR